MSNIEELKFDKKNFNKHTENGMRLLEKSLRDFGAGRSILVDKDNNIIAGNGIVESAINAGITKTRVVETTGDELVVVKRTDVELDTKKGREMALADNATASADLEWDDDLLKDTFTPEELDTWDVNIDWETPAEVVEDEAPEVEEEAKSKLGEIYALGSHRLMCGDATSHDDMGKLLAGEMVDLWMTDPPYNINYHGKSKGRKTILNDSMGNEAFHEFLVDSSEVAHSVMKDGAAFYIFHSDQETVNFRTACTETGLAVKECLIWNKDNLVLSRQDYHWKHEPCLYGWKEGTHHWYSDRKQTTVINWERPKVNKEHPTMKPVGLVAYLVQNSTQKGDKVLDSFGGSGSTLIACEQTGRVCYIMELDPRYCDVIRKRYWKLATGDEEGWEEGTKAQ